jgi:hypothetical protein
MFRPRPVPPKVRVVEASAWVKAPNSLDRVAGLMPMPVSVTVRRTSVRPVRGSGAQSRVTSTRPTTVNFRALDSRLARHWRTRTASNSSIGGGSPATVKVSSTSFSRAVGW